MIIKNDGGGGAADEDVQMDQEAEVGDQRARAEVDGDDQRDQAGDEAGGEEDGGEDQEDQEGSADTLLRVEWN